MSKKITKKGAVAKAKTTKAKTKKKTKVYCFGELKKEKIKDEPVYGWPYT
jgi:hypothetical protein